MKNAKCSYCLCQDECITANTNMDEQYCILDPKDNVLTDDTNYVFIGETLWVTVGNMAVCVHKRKTGIKVDIFADGLEDRDALGTAEATFIKAQDMIDRPDDVYDRECYDCGNLFSESDSCDEDGFKCSICGNRNTGVCL